MPTTFNLDATLERLEGDRDLLAAMAGMFVAQYEAMLEELTTALALDQREEAERAAHSLKGVVSNFGADTVRDLSRDIEILCRQAELAESRQRLPALNQATQALANELAQYFPTA